LPCDQRLSRDERITEEYEYKTVIRGGKLIWAETFKAYLLSGRDLERKAGFIAGKGVGGACERNRARRLLKEAYRHLKQGLQPGGFNVVFVARRGAAEAHRCRIETEMKGLFDQCGLVVNQ
jgi:ribonuclease P protein component